MVVAGSRHQGASTYNVSKNSLISIEINDNKQKLK
jgi:hypothetical protein